MGLYFFRSPTAKNSEQVELVMKRFTAASFLLVTILTASMLLQGQTRPRRVGPPPAPDSESRVAPVETPVEQPVEQPMERPVERPIERPANHRWRNILLGGAAAIAIGAGGVCSPSRDVLIRRPRL